MDTFILKTGGSLALKAASNDSAEPFEISVDVEADTVAGDISAQVDTQGGYLVIWSGPNSRIFGGHGIDTVTSASFDESLFQKTDVVPWRQVVCLQIDDGICNKLARAVESGLATAKGFVEFSIAMFLQIGLLFCRHSADFTSTTRVDGGELGSDDGWHGSRDCCRRSLVG